MGPRWFWRIASAAWLAAISFGFFFVWRYAARPGESSRAPATWPAASTLPRSDGRATLLMFVHPHCSCSRASLRELGNLLRRVPGRADALVVLVRDDASDLRQIAASLPNGRVVLDERGEESRRFGAATSGATLLYDAQGRLEFSGGLTAIRGHEGDSFGQERVVALLQGGAADRRDSPVFGCPLEDPKEARP